MTLQTSERSATFQIAAGLMNLRTSTTLPHHTPMVVQDSGQMVYSGQNRPSVLSVCVVTVLSGIYFI